MAGARGFIGRRLCALAVEAGAIVIAPDLDVRDAAAVERAIDAPDVVLNLAAPVNVARDEALWPQMEAVIVHGTRNLRAAAGAARFVQVGTCEEYGTIEAPFAEDDVPSEPVSPYSRAKLQATGETVAAGGIVARPFLTYGPGQRPRQLVPAAIDAALARRPFPMTTGLQTRELNYVDDTALGLLRCAVAPDLTGIVNVAGGDERRVIDIVQRIFELAGAPAELIQAGARPTRPGEVERFFADTRRCRDVLGHRPSMSLDEGLRRTLDARRAA